MHAPASWPMLIALGAATVLGLFLAWQIAKNLFKLLFWTVILVLLGAAIFFVIQGSV
jgi:ABC-type uncharacterized transport system permease subunit